jgi:hypothetical protein
MNIDLLALLAITTLSVVLVATLTAYLRTKERMRQMEEQADEIAHKAHLKATRILEHAQEAAFQIANDAILKAEVNKDLIKEKLEEVAGKQLKEYQQMLIDSSGGIEKEAVRMLSLKMDEEWIKVQKEIAAYKNQKKAELDNKAIEVIKRFSSQVIGKTMDSSTHTALLIEALESAKKEYGF